MSDNSISSDFLPSITILIQINKCFRLREGDVLDLLQTSLPHLMGRVIDVSIVSTAGGAC